MKIVKQIQRKIVIFTAVKKMLYIAWACFRKKGISRDAAKMNHNQTSHLKLSHSLFFR